MPALHARVHAEQRGDGRRVARVELAATARRLDHLRPRHAERTPGSRPSRSAAAASTDAPPNVSPTHTAATSRCRRCARRAARATPAPAPIRRRSPRAGARRPTPRAARRPAGRSARARSNSARSAAPCAAPTLPPRKRSSCAATSHGAPPIAMRAVTTPSSSCACDAKAREPRARAARRRATRRGRRRRSRRCARAARSARKRRRGGVRNGTGRIGVRGHRGKNTAPCHDLAPVDERQPLRAVRAPLPARARAACMMVPGGPVIHYDELADWSARIAHALVGARLPCRATAWRCRRTRPGRRSRSTSRCLRAGLVYLPLNTALPAAASSRSSSPTRSRA